MIQFPNISPEIFSVTIGGFDLALRWYAVSYIMGFVCALYIMKYCLRREELWQDKFPPMEVEQADSILTYLIIGVIVGGRLGYVLFYNFDFYVVNPLNIIRVWDGGMAFHGGFIGVVVAVMLYSKFNGIALWSASDLIAISAPPGLFFGRLANFINSELWGKPTEVPWGVIFPGGLNAQICPGYSDPCARHPTQLYEAGLEGFLLLLLLLVAASLGAFRRRGLITGLFAVGYGSSRYFVEYYRVPDPQFFNENNPYGFAFVFGEFGITMGQTLSIPMIFFGIVLIIKSMGNQKENGS